MISAIKYRNQRDLSRSHTKLQPRRAAMLRRCWGLSFAGAFCVLPGRKRGRHDDI